MNFSDLNVIRNKIDNEISNIDANIGVAFGIELYKAFAANGWLTREVFSVSGTGAFPINVIAYNKTHNAVADWELEDWTYKVGSRG